MLKLLNSISVCDTVEIGVVDVKPMHMPVLKCSHRYYEAHGFKANYRREDLVVVHSLNLGEAFCH